MKLFLIAALFAYTVNAAKYGHIDTNLEPLTDEIIKAINHLNSTWQAGKTFSGYRNFTIDSLVVTREETFDHEFTNKTYSINLRKHLPKNFDARAKWPNCTSIGKIYDQIKGYPSWIYPAVNSIADRICIKTGAEIDVQATVDEILRSNGGYDRFNSANIGQAFHYWSKKGIFIRKSIKDSNCLPLVSKCQENEIQFDKYYEVSVESPVIWLDKMRDIMTYGPIPAYMEVYSDFPSYQSGVYQRTSKKYLGMHNVKLIGWGVENGVHYWLATNSWSTEWGIDGVFKIRIQTADFRKDSPMYSATFKFANTPSDIPKTNQQGQIFLLA